MKKFRLIYVIQAHLRMAEADRKERGESAETARTGAVRELGNPTLLKDVTRATWGWLLQTASRHPSFWR
jgi:hypothetical protein